MSSDYDKFAAYATEEEIVEILLERDAEIARLKLVISEDAVAIGDKSRLITELADALVKENHVWFNEGDDLIQRAREATK